MALRLRQPQSRVRHKLQPRTACCEGARCEQTFHPRRSNKSHPLPCSFHVGCACEPLALTSSCRDKGKPGLVTGVTCRDKMVMDTAVCAPPHRHALHPPAASLSCHPVGDLSGLNVCAHCFLSCLLHASEISLGANKGGDIFVCVGPPSSAYPPQGGTCPSEGGTPEGDLPTRPPLASSPLVRLPLLCCWCCCCL